MYRIDVPTATGVLPAPAAPGVAGYFTDGNPATSTPATIVPADFLNMVQEELTAIAVAAGGGLSKATRNQCITAINALISAAIDAGAIQLQAGNYAAAAGTNTITATFTPAIAAHAVGRPLRVKIANTNTGAATFNPGPSAVSVVNAKGGALVSGDLVIGEIVEFIYDGTNYQYRKVPQFATKTEMETATEAAKIVTPAQLKNFDGIAKVHAEWDNNGESGTTEITYGVSGVTDDGVGQTTLSFVTAFASVAYSSPMSAGNGASTTSAETLHPFSIATKLAGSIKVEGASTNSGAAAVADFNYNFASFFGRH